MPDPSRTQVDITLSNASTLFALLSQFIANCSMLPDTADKMISVADARECMEKIADAMFHMGVSVETLEECWQHARRYI